MKNSILITVIVLLIVIPAIGIIMLLTSSNEMDNPAVSDPVLGDTVFPPSTPTIPLENQPETTTIPGVDGQIITMTNMARLPGVTDVGEGLYVIDGEEVMGAKPYSLLFNQTDGSYAISLETVPLTLSREKASQDFLEILDITVEEACKLNVYVGVSVSIDLARAGQNLGLSYCPNAAQL